MSLKHREFRQRWQDFWLKRQHKEAPPIGLIPKEDPTTLFTGSGMQPLVPYLLGEPHPQGSRLFNIQPCLRAQDIEEVGDNRHTTAFEMVGNWSLGTYFKQEQLRYAFTFLTDDQNGLGLDPNRLYATVFAGNSRFEGEDTDGHKSPLGADNDAIEVWKQLFNEKNISTPIVDVTSKNITQSEINHGRIFLYADNWWSRSGKPDKMPAGEPGGPDSEVFFDFGADLEIHEHSQFKDQICHPNCDCGRFMEIGNSVFMQFSKQTDGSFKELPKKNVDFGGGFERLLAAVNDDPDVFTTDLFTTIIKAIEESTGIIYHEAQFKSTIRIVADHMKAATFLIMAGVFPANKERGYVLRRLLRRALVKMHKLQNKLPHPDVFVSIAKAVLETYSGIYFNPDKDIETIAPVITDEIHRFSKTLEKGLREVQKVNQINAKIAFDLYQTYGFPLEITAELFKEKGQSIDQEEFQTEFNKHKEASRSASAGMFKGGLADQSEQTVRYHTATHLIHQALFDVIGSDIRQEGSNITAERLRFDFFSQKRPEKSDIDEVQKIVDEKIKESIPVQFKMVPKEKALELGAKSFFREKYPEIVKVYYIGSNDLESAYSKEFCGGPHVKNTNEIGKIEIYKFEKIGSNTYRIYAK